MAEKYKLLMDMDIGDDIDDAIALYCAMRQGFDIVGVTTVFRNTADRAKMAKKLVTLSGHGDIPVYAGYGVPLAEKEREYGHVIHYTPDTEAYAPDSVNPDDAADFIIHACRTYGKELCIIAIGPFTNMARVIQKDPEALNLAGRVCIMGGAYFKQYADWNVMCDVEAADLMFRTLENLECIGADVTHLCEAEPALYDALVNYTGDDPARRYLTEMCGLWRKDRPDAKLLLHDPLVVYYAEDPSLCGMREITAAVLTDGFARGMTVNVNAYGKKWMNESAYAGYPMKLCRAAQTVDLDGFNQRILGDYTI
ncbi:MAG: nucleoside hydrolase [Clostridia bacterium]|nr:nucleoside hydrolase [Clostridia bacterium]